MRKFIHVPDKDHIPAKLRLMDALTPEDGNVFIGLNRLYVTQRWKSISSIRALIDSQPQHVTFLAVPFHRKFMRVREQIERTATLSKRHPVHSNLVDAVAMNNFPRRARYQKEVVVYMLYSPVSERAKPNKYGYVEEVGRAAVLAKIVVSPYRTRQKAIDATRGKLNVQTRRPQMGIQLL